MSRVKPINVRLPVIEGLKFFVSFVSEIKVKNSNKNITIKCCEWIESYIIFANSKLKKVNRLYIRNTKGFISQHTFYLGVKYPHNLYFICQNSYFIRENVNNV